MLSLRTDNVLYAVLFSLFHETGHISAMTVLGNAPQSVTFELTGINIKRPAQTSVSLAKEIVIALSGPFFNFILFLIFVLIYSQNKNEKVLNMASVNLILMIFNLMPIKGLDGGKVLYFTVSKFFSYKKAKNILTISSVIFILLMFTYGAYVLYLTRYNFTMLIIALMLTLSMFSKEEC